jgi:hypothetical protein
MATARPFAYNTGSPITGTIQVGSLAVGTPTSGFTGNPKWWNGADEELGYVIAIPVSGNTQPTPISGVTASVGFSRTNGFNTTEFVSLANKIAGQSYTGATQASTGLTSLGYWNSYPADDMGLYYKFDGNFNDSSGNYNNGTGGGTYSFSPSYAAKTGFTQGVFIINTPSQGYVSIPNSITYKGNGGTNLSLFTWVYMLGFGANQMIFDALLGNSAAGGFYLKIGTTTNKGIVSIMDSIFTESSTLSRGVWYHVGFTVETIGVTSTLKTYLNSTLVATSASGNNQRINNGATSTIGTTANAPGVSYPFQGYLDELVIYNKTLSQAEITALYNRTTPIK